MNSFAIWQTTARPPVFFRWADKPNVLRDESDGKQYQQAECILVVLDTVPVSFRYCLSISEGWLDFDMTIQHNWQDGKPCAMLDAYERLPIPSNWPLLGRRVL